MVTQQRLTRSASDKVIGGVCGGLGQYFGIDPVIVRLIMVALVFVGGMSVLLYPVLWLVMPVEGVGQATLGQGLQEMQRQAQNFSQQATQQAQVFGQQVQDTFSTPRFDPQTGQPLNAVQPERRNRVLGIVLLGVGMLMLASMFGNGQLAIALMILGGGIYLLRRTN